jgi:hypothetical protein
MMPTPHPVPARKSYDLYLGFGGKRFVWTNPDHGVTLTDDDIAWYAGGREWQARLRDIATVHLRTGNIGEYTIATCRLSFSDATTLLITSANSRGLQNETQDKLYVEFMQDFHARLAALKDAPVAFSAGLSDARYRFGKVVVVVAGSLFIVTPTVLLLMTREWQMVWALSAGILLVWPVYRVMKANAPRRYDPRHVPLELLP